MTVKELIAQLSALPQDAEVVLMIRAPKGAICSDEVETTVVVDGQVIVNGWRERPDLLDGVSFSPPGGSLNPLADTCEMGATHFADTPEERAVDHWRVWLGTADPREMIDEIPEFARHHAEAELEEGRVVSPELAEAAIRASL